MTLTEFLLARIAEDEQVAQDVQGQVQRGYCEDATGSAATVYFDIDYMQGGANISAARVLAECEAKRRIVEDFEILHRDYRETHNSTTGDRRFQALVAISQLAAVYADHPDYDEAWRA